MPQIGSSNDHELAIARSIDRIAAKGPIGAAEICEALLSLDFMVCRRDCEFLVFYVHWRKVHPVT
jgi:hypothetical protein